MYVSAGIFAITLLHVTSAIPIAQSNPPSVSIGNTTTAPNVPIKSGNPFSFPLPNGFNGTLSPDALQSTNVQAHGTEPNGGAPTLSDDDLTSIQLIAFNEIFEVAFFTDLLSNVTSSELGYSNVRDLDIAALTAVQAQEELHADNANAILKANGKNPIEPCQYKFPTTNLPDALGLAKTFTDVVLGTLQDVILHLAENGAADVVPIIGSVIGQEGQQDGFFRLAGGLIPSAQPFLTRATREFAFSALNQMFVVPGSCPNIQEIDLPVFAPLTVNTQQVAPQDQTISFSVNAENISSTDGLSLVYINGQNTPLVENITNVANDSGVITFEANFPFNENLLFGLTIAALTNSTGPFASAEAVANATVAGPGLIEVQ